MIIRNIQLALRRIFRQPVFSLINGIGLTLGLVAFFFILQYVVFQRSFNSMYPTAATSYRLLDGPLDGEINPYTMAGLTPLLKEEIPGVDFATRYMRGIGAGTILLEDPATQSQTSYREDEVVFVDHDFLTLFPRGSLAGTPDLSQPNTMVLTESTAMQYFKTTDIVGQSVNLINQFGEHPFQITGVVEDFPINSDIQAKVLASMITFETASYIGDNTWMDVNTLQSSFVFTYLGLNNPEVVGQVEAFSKQ